MAKTTKSTRTAIPAPTTAEDAQMDPRAAAAQERARRAARKATPATPATPAPAPTHTEAQDAREAKTPKAAQVGGESVLRTGRLSARNLPCLCGCGAATHTKDARFLSGHDAKLRKALLLGGVEAMPEIVAPFFARGEEIGGIRIEGGEVVDTKPQMAR